MEPTVTLGPFTLGLLLGATAGIIVCVFGFLVLGAYGHVNWGVHVSPPVAIGLQHAFRQIAYGLGGALLANAANLTILVLTHHFAMPADEATLAGTLVAGALAGGHQTYQAIRAMRAPQQGGQA
jgi:hypothetical protein